MSYKPFNAIISFLTQPSPRIFCSSHRKQFIIPQKHLTFVLLLPLTLECLTCFPFFLASLSLFISKDSAFFPLGQLQTPPQHFIHACVLHVNFPQQQFLKGKGPSFTYSYNPNTQQIKSHLALLNETIKRVFLECMNE